jgi:hypothetical protein
MEGYEYSRYFFFNLSLKGHKKFAAQRRVNMSKLPEHLSEEASQDSKYKELRKQYGEAEYRYQV